MIKRTIEVSGADTRLCLRMGQVCVMRGGEAIGRVPAEDVGMLIVDSPSTVYTHGLLTRLVEMGVAVVLCGEDHHPTGLLTATAGNSVQTERLAAQAAAKLPLKKRLWRQLVRAKIRNQAANLGHAPEDALRLETLAREVRSGDPENKEAQAARIYWSAWLPGKPFLRRRTGEPPNNLLNYGYAVVRAAVARSLAGAGLHPSIGVHHHNRYDSFCLADDLMEPLRPLVDRAVRDIFLEGTEEICRESKEHILAVLAEAISWRTGKGPLFVELEKMTASLARCFLGQERKLFIPRLL